MTAHELPVAAGRRERRSSRPAMLTSPTLILAAALAACAILLTLPLVLPLGAMYWDLSLYLDATNRIAAGQRPLIDFLAPVGPLGYWLFSGLSEFFPRSQPLLLAQWSLLAVTAPVALGACWVGYLKRPQAR